MSKRKRSAPTVAAVDDWGDLEQAFFAAAPPDEPEAPEEAARFDDLTSTAPPRPVPAWIQRGLAAIRQLLDAGAQALEGQVVGVLLVALSVLVGLSAVVFASVR
jgi:hypothetical protein